MLRLAISPKKGRFWLLSSDDDDDELEDPISREASSVACYLHRSSEGEEGSGLVASSSTATKRIERRRQQRLAAMDLRVSLSMQVCTSSEDGSRSVSAKKLSHLFRSIRRSPLDPYVFPLLVLRKTMKAGQWSAGDDQLAVSIVVLGKIR